MSDNLLQTVPIFNGDNLRGWKTTMEAVLQSKDCFWVIDSERPSSSDVKVLRPELSNYGPELAEL
jgi:hypothetical protein